MAAVQSGRILSREAHKVRMRSDNFASFGNNELVLVAEQLIERSRTSVGAVLRSSRTI